MGIRKFNKEGPSTAQLGDVLYNFAWMLILKIVVYLFMKQLYIFFMKIINRHQAANVEAETNVETCDKKQNTPSEPEPAQGESVNLGRKKNDIYNRKNVEILLRKFQDRLAKEKLH